MVTKTYVGLLTKGEMPEVQKFLDENGLRRKGIGAVLVTPETRQFVVNLFVLEIHMRFTTAFSTKWIKEQMFGIYGGVSDIIYAVT